MKEISVIRSFLEIESWKWPKRFSKDFSKKERWYLTSLSIHDIRHFWYATCKSTPKPAHFCDKIAKIGPDRPKFRILHAKRVHRLEKSTPPPPVSKKAEFFKIKTFIRFLEKGEMVAGKV